MTEEIGTRRGHVAVGHPIDVATGEMFATRVDHELEGAVPFSVGRTFNTRFVAPRLLQTAVPEKKHLPFGPGWRASWQVELRVSLSGFIYTRVDGQEFSFDDPIDVEKNFATTGKITTHYDCVELQRIDENHVRVIGFGTDRSTHSLVFEERDREKYRLKSIERTPKARLDFYYDKQSRVTAVWQAPENRGYEIEYEGDRVARVLLRLPDRTSRVVVEYLYDYVGRLIEVIDARGTAVEYNYDRENRITHEQSRDGSTYDLRYENGRCVHATGANGFEERSLRFDKDALTTWVTDSHGKVIKYEWNKRGQVMNVLSPTGNATSQIFDEWARIVQYGNEDGSTIDYQYDEVGRTKAIRSSRGDETEFHYDEHHRLIAYEELVDGVVATRVKFTHDEDHNVASIQINEEPPWKYVYDEFGQVGRITAPSGATVWHLCDEYGRIKRSQDWDGQTWLYTRDVMGRVLTETDPLGHTMHITYLDDDGRSMRVTDRDGRVYERHVGNDDRSIVIVLPGGAQRRLVLSSCGMPVRLTDEMGEETRLVWGTEPGELVQIIKANNEFYSFAYDADMRVVARRTFDCRVLRTEYKRGRVIATTDGAGQRTEYAYNLRGFISEQTNADGVTKFGYDLQGLVTNIETPTNTLHLHRDSVGRIVAEEQDGIKVERKLDVMGRPIAHSTPYGPGASFSWTAGGDCQSIKYGDVAIDFTRDARGREVGRQLGEAGYFQQGYDPVGRLVAQTFHRTPDTKPGAQPLAPEVLRRFGFDARGFLSNVQDAQRGSTRLMHNARGDLTGVVRDRGISDFYKYDGRQNRVYHAATEYGATVAERIDREEGKGPNDWKWVMPNDMVRWAASGVPHQETWQDHAWGGRTEVLRGHGRPLTELQYNANGQVISKTVSRGAEKYTWKYDWNARGELIALTTPNGKKWEYRYDASGRRIEKKCPTGDSWRYIWMGHELLHTLRNDKLVESYLHEPGGGCPILRDDGAIHFILPDQNASPAEEVGPDGKIEYLYQKGTWGEGFQRHGETGGQPFLGQWFDAESGLHYNHFRYYDPETGRYLSPDPIGLAGGFNVYGGVSDPFCQYDRFGLATAPTAPAGCPNTTTATNPTTPGAAESLPQMKGSSIAEAEQILAAHGFTQTHVSNSPGQNQTWSHPDGSEVRIHPYGNVAQAPYRSANNAHLHKESASGAQLTDRGIPSTTPSETHIGLSNPPNLPTVRGRPHGAGTQ